MVIKKSEQGVVIKNSLRDGKGNTCIRHILTPQEFKNNAKMFSVITLEPGCSIGWHMHYGESETYYIIRGKALVNDNGEEKTLAIGDCSFTASGSGHSIENIGDDVLEFIAMVLNE